MAKSAPFHIKSPVKNFHGRPKGGHRTMPPLNTPLDKDSGVLKEEACIARVTFRQVYIVG